MCYHYIEGMGDNQVSVYVLPLYRGCGDNQVSVYVLPLYRGCG